MHAELSTRIADLESVESRELEKRLGARERDSMLKLVIGMAIKGYGYDPKAGRSGAAREIAGDLLLAGLALDEDTIRKYFSVNEKPASEWRAYKTGCTADENLPAIRMLPIPPPKPLPLNATAGVAVTIAAPIVVAASQAAPARGRSP